MPTYVGMSTIKRLRLDTVGKRLAEERKRLGLNQTDFAEAGGIKRASQVNYETGRRSPDSDYWEAVAKIGVDVQYVLTGIHSENLARIAIEAAETTLRLAGVKVAAGITEEPRNYEVRKNKDKKTIYPAVLIAVAEAIDHYDRENDKAWTMKTKIRLALELQDLFEPETLDKEGVIRDNVAKIIQLKVG